MLANLFKRVKLFFFNEHNLMVFFFLCYLISLINALFQRNPFPSRRFGCLLLSILLSSIPIRWIHRSVSKQENRFVLAGRMDHYAENSVPSKDGSAPSLVSVLSFVNARRYFLGYFRFAAATIRNVYNNDANY